MSKKQDISKLPIQNPQKPPPPKQDISQLPPKKPMPTLYKAFLAFLGGGFLLVLCCAFFLGGRTSPTPTAVVEALQEIEQEESTNTPRPTVTPISTKAATNTPKPKNTSTPTGTVRLTSTPKPTDTPIPVMSKEESLKKWRVPFISSALAIGLCRQTILDPAKINPLGYTILLTAAAEGIEDWEPESDQVEIKNQVSAEMTAFGDVLVQLSENEIAQTELPAALDETCSSLGTTWDNLREQAKNDGLTDDDFQDFFVEIEESLTSSEAPASEPTATTTPAPTQTNVPTPTDTPMPVPTLTSTATPAPIPPTPTLPPPPTNTPVPAAPPAACGCSGDSYNCGDFSTHAEAQGCFDYCVAQGAGDIHRLDQDNDGDACESLP
jgi:hypothetical protein